MLTIADLGFCADRSWDRDAAQAVVKHHATAFLPSELLGDDDATSALADAPDLPNVRYRTTGFWVDAAREYRDELRRHPTTIYPLPATGSMQEVTG